ncbi:MAG: ABC transporter permease [Deltaproteobacteria bacterium]|nr:ABC transporter permease [Deltaproteobacteria bacterium]
MNFWRRTAAVARKEVRQLRRDYFTAGMIVGLPAIQLLLFGYAINTDVRHLRAGVADAANTQLSRRLVADAEASQVVDVVAQVETPEQLEELLREGEIAVGIAIPRDFERRARREGRAPAQLLVDGADPALLIAARGLASLPIAARPTPRAEPTPTFEVRPFYNPERRSAVQIVPGLIGVILTMTMVLFTSVAIVRERERGNLELIINTPVRTTELMLGKISPYVAIGMIQTTLILLLGRAVFDVPIAGSLFDLYAGSLIFVTSVTALGLLFSTLVSTQMQAFQLTFMSFLPQILMSGFMFPFDGMPKPARLVAEIFPLTHFVRLVRGIILRGASLGEVRGELWPLALFFVVTVSIAIARFRKRLD